MSSAPDKSLFLPYLVLTLIFTVFAIYGSLVPLNLVPISLSTAIEQFISGLSSIQPRGSRIDWGVNLLLFVPISFFWLQLIADRAGNIRRCAAVVVVVAGCTALSIAIEFAQNWFPPRVPSAGDVAAQFVGTGVGVALWLAAGRTASEWFLIYWADTRPQHRFDWLLQAYLVGFVLYSLMPLNVTISPVEIYQKYKQGRILIAPFSWDYASLLQASYELATDILVFIPVGMLATIAMTPASRPVRRFWPAVAVGFACVVGIELGQLLVLSRITDVTDIITGTIGVAAGIGIMRYRRAAMAAAPTPRKISTERPRIAWKWLAASAGYAVLLVVLFLAPFDFTTEKEVIKERLGGFLAVPLSAAVRGNRFAAATALLRKVLLFMPLGAMFVMTARTLPTRFRRLLLGVLLVLGWGWALAIELGQVLLPSRAAVFDDSLFCTAGMVIGMLVTSRVVADDAGVRRRSHKD